MSASIKIDNADLANAINLIWLPNTATVGTVITAERAARYRKEAIDFLAKCREIPTDLSYADFNRLQGGSRAYVRGWQISLDEARATVSAARLIMSSLAA